MRAPAEAGRALVAGGFQLLERDRERLVRLFRAGLEDGDRLRDDRDLGGMPRLEEVLHGRVH